MIRVMLNGQSFRNRSHLLTTWLQEEVQHNVEPINHGLFAAELMLYVALIAISVRLRECSMSATRMWMNIGSARIFLQL